MDSEIRVKYVHFNMVFLTFILNGVIFSYHTTVKMIPTENSWKNEPYLSKSHFVKSTIRVWFTPEAGEKRAMFSVSICITVMRRVERMLLLKQTGSSVSEFNEALQIMVR